MLPDSTLFSNVSTPFTTTVTLVESALLANAVYFEVSKFLNSIGISLNSLDVYFSILTLIVTAVSDIDLTPFGLVIVSWYVLSPFKPSTLILTYTSLIPSNILSSP